MPKKAWFFKNKTLLGILGLMLVFGTLATGCPTDGGETEPTTYTVTFNADGGTPVPAEQKVEKGKTVEKPTNPTKTGYTFVAWHKDGAQWNFDTDTVSANITLHAKWVKGENVQLVTVTFNTNGGSAIAPVTVAKDDDVSLSSYRPTKTGNVFDGWYTNEALTTAAESYLTVTADITLYAKWTSTSELAQYAGVWRSDRSAYLLQDDGTAWEFSPDGYFDKSTWSPSQIDGDEVTFNADKTTFTDEDETTYTKNTADKKTPAAATALLGTWVDGSSSMELKSDKTAVLTRYDRTITLGYCVESDKQLYLLAPASNLVIVSFDITDSDFSKSTSDTALAGIWKLTAEGQDYYWTLDKDGKGTFHTLGASVPVSFTVTEDGKIDGESYTISSDTLTLPEAE